MGFWVTHPAQMSSHKPC